MLFNVAICEIVTPCRESCFLVCLTSPKFALMSLAVAIFTAFPVHLLCVFNDNFLE